MSSIARHFFVAVLSSASIACGAAAAESGAPATPAPERAPTTVDEAQAQFDRARIDLDRNIGNQTGGESSAAQPSTQGGAPAAAPPPPSAPPADASSSSSRNESTYTPREPTPCEQACRALASMRRAKDAICRMTSDADDKCSRAGKILSESEARASSCGCPR